MAIPWLTVLQAVPWSDVLAQAPKVVDAAGKLWRRTRQRASSSRPKPWRVEWANRDSPP